jgi:hypothetical protein
MIRMAFFGQARTQSPQARQAKGSGIGTVYGASCFISREGQACAAAQTPPSQLAGVHFVKSSSAIFLCMMPIPRFAVASEAHGFNSSWSLRWGM